MDTQLYLSASVFVAQANSVKTSQILGCLRTDDERVELLKLICVFWPELDESMNLQFLWEAPSLFEMNELHVALIQELPILAAVSKMDAGTLHNRYCSIKKYVCDVLRSIKMETMDFSSMEGFLKARIVLVDSHYPNSLWYLPLLEHINSQSLKKWLDGVLRPLYHLNMRQEDKLKIIDFEGMGSSKVMNLMWDLPVLDLSVIRSTVKYELKPYLEYTNSEDTFYEVIFNAQNFELKTQENFNIFKFLIMFDIVPDRSKTIAWKILFENGANLQKLSFPNKNEEVRSIISTLGNPDDELSGITVAQWNVNIQFMDDLEINDFKSLKGLHEETHAVQLSHFSVLVKNMFRSHLDIETLTRIINFINCSSLFNKLSHKAQQSVVIEHLLNSGNFDLLEQFLGISDASIEDEVLVQYFWVVFNDATTGSSSNPNMINATRTLNLLKDKAKYVHLFTLLKVSEELTHYALTLKRGISFQPSHLLEYKNDVFQIISKLLDLNPKLMKNVSKTFDLLQNIFVALDIAPSDNKYYSEYSRLLSEHINTSLDNGEFQFAFEQAIVLLERDDAEKYWMTIFQVGKYSDPRWLDGEIPTEIIYLQLGILSKLMHVCPEQEYEVIVSQWSGLELELSTRDIIRDKYSLENSQNRSEQIINEISSNLANFLSGKFQWNIGGD